MWAWATLITIKNPKSLQIKDKNEKKNTKSWNQTEEENFKTGVMSIFWTNSINFVCASSIKKIKNLDGHDYLNNISVESYFFYIMTWKQIWFIFDEKQRNLIKMFNIWSVRSTLKILNHTICFVCFPEKIVKKNE